MTQQTFTIIGMHCTSCAKLCQIIIKKMESVQSVDIKEDGTTNIVSKTHLDLSVINKELEKNGYHIKEV
ncbi:hypothetical protein CO172_01500 [Candidatus Uhrbacteria bacterium CG_4_9_14_3_um_filter_36_7]|uniref:HMA domain-containing protein n=1 Tax=Candidatus Uhrbacteria bacterium CG_4_9_14_3_um_filter_36_7 TaxID=1975033 RepID=A0A2M7XHP6_9BACT|nr:MAG: hypothetical protein CO172_01500 [Candidatus Uhrbacteria bacterium CG_4_9_14_3_um_filter_36_7]